MADHIAYKVLTGPQLADLLADRFAGAPVDLADGYVHLSNGAQLTETVDRHFAGQDDLHVAAITLAALDDTLRWEPSRGGDLFPHVYGPLRLAALAAHAPLTRDSAGQVVRPA